NFKSDEDRSKWCVNACMRSVRRNTDQPVNTNLGREICERIRPLDHKVNRFDAWLFASLVVGNFSVIAMLLGPAKIHAQQHLRPILAFCSASARVNCDNRAVDIMLPGKKCSQLDL